MTGEDIAISVMVGIFLLALAFMWCEEMGVRWVRDIMSRHDARRSEKDARWKARCERGTAGTKGPG